MKGYITGIAVGSLMVLVFNKFPSINPIIVGIDGAILSFAIFNNLVRCHNNQVRKELKVTTMSRGLHFMTVINYSRTVQIPPHPE
jgi:hypothetical protein